MVDVLYLEDDREPVDHLRYKLKRTDFELVVVTSCFEFEDFLNDGGDAKLFFFR